VFGSGDATIRRERFYKSDGRYHLDDLPAGKYDLTATVNGGEGRVAIELGKGERRDSVDFAIDASLVVSGRVVDLESQRPVAGMDVEVRIEGPAVGTARRATPRDASLSAACLTGCCRSRFTTACIRARD
jgi:hypothetical protein